MYSAYTYQCFDCNSKNDSLCRLLESNSSEFSVDCDDITPPVYSLHDYSDELRATGCLVKIFEAGKLWAILGFLIRKAYMRLKFVFSFNQFVFILAYGEIRIELLRWWVRFKKKFVVVYHAKEHYHVLYATAINATATTSTV